MILHPSLILQRRAKIVASSRVACGKLGPMVVVLLIFYSCLGSCQTLHAQTKVRVFSLIELREAIQSDNQAIAMKPGRYSLTDLP